jgi:cytochrome bd-type quinol oxidase subunit 2
VTDLSGVRRIGGWLLAASVLWWIAAAALIPPDDYFFSDSAQDEALSIAAHAGMFRAFHIVATVGIAAGVVGMIALARLLRSTERSRLVDTAAGVAVVTFVAWVAEAVIRVTVGVAHARDVAAGTRAPSSEPAVGSWPVFAIAAIGFAMPMLCAWVLARRRLPGRRSSLVAAVVLTLGTLAAAGTLAPSLVYQFGLLPLSLCLVLAHRRHAPAVARETATSWVA